MKPPICEVCNTDFEPRDGAYLTFGDQQGWCCPDHVEAARSLADTHTLREAIAALRLADEPASPEPDPDLGPLATAYAAQIASTSAHPILPHPIERLRAVFADAFVQAATGLGEGTAPEVEVTRGRTDLAPSDPREPESGGTEQSTTRTAATDDGQVVLHETSSRWDSGEEIRTTIALTGSVGAGTRFWLGGTSYAGAPVGQLELVGELPQFAAPALGLVLSALRTAPR